MTFRKVPQTNPDTLAKYSTTPGENPNGLRPGELAVNAADGCGFVGMDNGLGRVLPGAVGFRSIVSMTQAQYDALDPKDAQTLYIVTANPE